MFIKITKNAKGVGYYHLVETYREGSKVKHRTLLSLGRTDEGKLEQLSEAISKHTAFFTAMSLAQKTDIRNAYILGPLLVLETMMERLGIFDALAMIQDNHPRLTFDFQRVIFSLVASRFIKPVSNRTDSPGG